MDKQKDTKLFVSTILIIVVHVMGIIGTLSPYCGSFLLLTPINLLFSCLLLFANHKDFSPKFYLFCILCFIAGFIVEVIGVKTGNIFGSYHYGQTLGVMLFDVPLVIGINWLMLIYTTGVMVNRLKAHVVIKSLIASLLLVLLDFVIEPIAITNNFWTWQFISIPIQNYCAWFMVSFILLLLFYNTHFSKINRLSSRLYIVQFLFFVILNCITFLSSAN